MSNAAPTTSTSGVSISSAKDFISVYLKANIPCFIWGAPGVGKSDAVRQCADEYMGGARVIDFRAVLRDPVDLRGLPSIDKSAGVAKWLPPDDLPNEQRDGKKGILFLDELNAASQAVQAACFGLVLDRKVGEYVLPKGWRIVAAGNRQSDKAAAQRMPTALANRFAHIEVEASVNDWTAWANSNDIETEVIAFIRFRANLLHQMPQNNEPAFPTPRAWHNVSKVLPSLTNPKTRQQIIQGLVGSGASGEFEAFMRVYKNLPSIDSILASPKTMNVPEEISAKYAIAAGLARRVDQSNFSKALTYMERVSKDFEAMFVIDASKRDNALTHTKAFVEWAVRNEKYIK